MKGAQVLLHTLYQRGVEVCFMNPGTSEMHFVAALDSVPEMHSVLCLFEGVATGAADGYARMTDKPAATLLHLGPGLANGIANLHNARRARSPIVNVVGDHATYHQQYDAPLQSDIETLARNFSGWVRRTDSLESIAADAAEAVAAATTTPGQIATLIMPADMTWQEAGEQRAPKVPSQRFAKKDDTVELVAKALRSGEPCALLLGGAATRERGLKDASRVARATGAKLLCETFPARLERGAGLPAVDRLAYLGEFATAQMQGLRHLVLVGAPLPVSFFAYPDQPSMLVPDGCEVHVLAPPDRPGIERRLEELAYELDAPAQPNVAEAMRPDLPTGALNAQTMAQAVGALLPEWAVVVDEAQTGGLFAPGATAGAPRHDWLTLTGGSIGFGMPLATGAAVGSSGRKVLCIQADGSAMYTFQSLWTQVREGLDVTTILLNNRSYAILNLELQRVGADGQGPRAKEMLDLSQPDLDFVALAQGMGVPATRATTAEELSDQLGRALAAEGPQLIEAMMPASL